MNRGESQEPVVETVAKILSGLLGRDRVCAYDDLSALGGDSLDVFQMIAQVEKLIDVQIPLDLLPEPLTIEGLATVLNRIRQNAEVVDVARIERVSRDDELPLSYLQLYQLRYEATARFRSLPHDQGRMAMMLSIDGPLNLSILERAFNEIVRRHEVLRTRIDVDVQMAGLRIGGMEALTSGGSLLTGSIRPEIRFAQTLCPSARVTIERVRVDDCREGQREARTQEVVKTAAEVCFDYGRAPLMKITLVTTELEHHILVVAISRLVCDGWSFDILHREICESYAACAGRKRSPLPELPIQYVDFASWQWRELQGRVLDQLTSFWVRQYSRYEPLTISELSICSSVPPSPSRRCGTSRLLLSAEVTAPLWKCARCFGTSLFVLFLTGFNILLHFYSGRQRIGVVSYFSNRRSAALAAVVGWFAQPHMVGIAVEPDVQVGELIEQARTRVTEASVYQDIPSPLLAKHLQQRKHGTSVLSDMASPKVTLEFRTYSKRPSPPGLTVRRIPVTPSGETHWGLRMLVSVMGSAITLTVVYRSDRFAEEDISAFLEDFRNVLQRIPDWTATPVAGFSSCMRAAPNGRAAGSCDGR